MKTMKKSIKFLAVLVIALLFSCSSDDSGSSSNSDKIIGTWKQVSESLNGVDQPLSDCELMDKTRFKADYIFTEDDYSLQEGDCVLQPAITTYVTKWSKVSNSEYDLKNYVNGVQADYVVHFTVVFSDNDNTMTMTTSSGGQTGGAVFHRL